MNIPLTHAAEGLERRAFTVRDVTQMVELGILGQEERFELIGGEIVPMNPKGLIHERFKQWLMKNLTKRLPSEFEVIQETTFYLTDDTFIEPDFIIYPAVSGLEKLSPKTCLLAIEIADASLAYDLGRKAEIYAQFGIKEMWVIDVKSAELTRHLEPVDGVFTQVEQIPWNVPVSPLAVSDYSIDLSEYK